MEITFWGTRGSIPVPGNEYAKYGGNTPCLELRTASGETIIIDAGSGLRELGNKIVSDVKSGKYSLLMSHTHWDHIQGIPFFKPFYIKGFEFDIFFPESEEQCAEDMIDVQMQPLYFPVTKDVFGSQINYKDFKDIGIFDFKNLEVSIAKVHHSKNTHSYKFTENGKSIVYMTDNEIMYNAADHEPEPEIIYKNNSDLIEFCRDADYLIHDSMYFFNDFKNKIGWGHSNNKSLSIFASLANVKNLLLFHYDPDHNDETVDRLAAETKMFLKEYSDNIKCIASKEGMTIKI
ncbi:MAG: MBL fold metallo-hydrolase [Melioribacteraceae bacterium]|nr:MAG: MBL fold metallo-hydrolase [Melioribacteraceae bacterium]